MQKYGFIYIWFDKKHKRFYIGRHWGTEDDGYICSSTVMREAHRRRPNDFKRRVVSRIYTSKDDLIVEEQRWLNMIKKEECGIRYYNKTLKSITPSTLGYYHSAETIIKIRESNLGKTRSEETKENLRLANKKQFENPVQREMRRQKSLELWNDPQYRKKQSIKKQGKKQSLETIDKRNRTKEMRGKKGGAQKGCTPWNKGLNTGVYYE